MPSNAKVFIKYGPYEAVGVVDYRDARLKGLQGGYSLVKLFFTTIGVILHNCLGVLTFHSRGSRNLIPYSWSHHRCGLFLYDLSFNHTVLSKIPCAMVYLCGYVINTVLELLWH